jgi:hypothetical protein
MSNDALKALRELVATKELHDQLEILKPLPPEREEEYRTRRVAAWAAARAAIEMADAQIKSRWRCPCCKSLNVQVSLPTWYHENIHTAGDTDLVFVETDSDADISWWYCEDCEETDYGQPEDVLDDEKVTP